MVIVFGLFHGLVFFPTLLGLVGPSAYSHDTNDQVDNGKPNMTFENFKAALFSNPFFYFSRFPALLKEKSRSLMCQPLEKMGGHYTKEILAKEGE